MRRAGNNGFSGAATRRSLPMATVMAMVCGALVASVASVALIAPSTAGAVDDGQLVAQHSGKCVTIDGASLDDGAGAVQGQCSEAPNQLFSKVLVADGFMLEAQHSGKCLSVPDVKKKERDGARIIQLPCVESNNQVFTVEGGNQYVFRHSGDCVNVSGASHDDGAVVEQRKCGGQISSQFDFEVVQAVAAIPDDGLPAIAVAGSNLVSERTERLAAGVVGINDGNDSFPDTNIRVTSFAEIGDVMYVGGKFTQVEIAATRQRHDQRFLAAFNRETGEWIDSFRPTLDGNVWDLKATDDGRLVVAGQFTSVNGDNGASGLAILDAVTGELDATWRIDLELTGSARRPIARTIDIQDDWLYVGGNFTRAVDVNGNRASVGQMMRVSLSAGFVDSAFRPNFDGVVFDIDATAERVYVVGNFFYVNDQWSIGTAVLQQGNGQAVPGLSAPRRNELRNTRNSYQQAILAVGDEVWQVGAQHHRHVYDADGYDFIREWTSFNWGDGQALAELNGVIYVGSHANAQTNLHQDASRFSDGAGTTSKAPIRWMEALDAENPQHLTQWYPAIGVENGEGSWELFADSTDCLWTGGDFNRGSYDGNTPRYVGGFAKFCSSDSTPPAAPTSPTALVSNGGINLSWAASTGDDRGGQVRYEVLKNDGVFASYISLTTFRDPDGTLDDRYFVRAMDTAGNRSATTRVFAADGADTTRPSIPADLAGVVEASGDVTLTWAPSTDNIGVTGYTVFRNNVEIARVDGPTALISAPAAGDHWYQVSAFDAAGNHGFRNQPLKVTILADDITPPSTPTELAGTIDDDGNVALTWTAPTDDVAVTGYIVSRNNVEIARTTDPVYVVPAPAAGDHFYQVRAFDAAGNVGLDTPSLQITIAATPDDDTQPPRTPRDLVGVIEASGDVTLTWTVPDDNVGVTGFIVFRNAVEIARTTDPTHVVAAPAPGSHWYQVRAFDAAGNEGSKTPSTRIDIPATPDDDTQPPQTPRDLVGVVEPSGDVTLSWTPSTDDVGVVGYIVFRNGVEIARTAVPTHVVPSPTVGKHFYQVRAFDAAGNESFKTPSTLVDIAVAPGADVSNPRTPQDLVGVVEASGDVTLSWTPSTDDVGVAGYIVFRNAVEIARTTEPTYVVPAPAAGSHWYQVRAFDAAGNESYKTPSTRIDI